MYGILQLLEVHHGVPSFLDVPLSGVMALVLGGGLCSSQLGKDCAAMLAKLCQASAACHQLGVRAGLFALLRVEMIGSAYCCAHCGPMVASLPDIAS
jgi:hypothetical protein